MVDKVKPLKYESPSLGGTETDYIPTESDPNEDFVAAKGISFEGLDTYLFEKIGGVLKERFPLISFKYDTNFNIAYYEIYKTATQTTGNRLVRSDLTYSGDNVTSESLKIYSESDGTTVLRTITMTYTYSGDDLIKHEVSEA